MGEDQGGQPSTPPDAPVILHSDHLFQGGRVLHILHEGAVYQLRLTKLGKLILTK